jgi:hypothetical protein
MKSHGSEINLHISKLMVADTQHELTMEEMWQAIERLQAGLKVMQIQVSGMEICQARTSGSLEKISVDLENSYSSFKSGGTTSGNTGDSVNSNASGNTGITIASFKEDAMEAAINWLVVAALSLSGSAIVGLGGYVAANHAPNLFDFFVAEKEERQLKAVR